MSETTAETVSAKLGASASQLVLEHAPLAIWSGTKDGKPVTLTFLTDAATQEQKARFVLGAKGLAKLGEDAGSSRLLPVSELDEEAAAFLSPAKVTGTLFDAPDFKWSLERKLEVVRAVAGALAALHGAKLVHGALCPRNVLLDAERQPLVAEAAIVSVAAAADPNVYGTYASPEARAGGKLAAGADVYSLGRVMAFLLLDGEPVEETEEVPRLEALASSVHAGLVRIVRKCTALDPEVRYPSIALFLKDLNQFGAYTSVGLTHPQVFDKQFGRADTMLGQAVTKAPAPARFVPPPEQKRSVPPPAQAQRPRREGIKIPAFIPLSLGGLVLVLSCAMAFFGTVPAPVATVLACFGAAIAGLGLPALGGRALASRVMWAGLLVTAIVLGGPATRLAASGQQHRLRTADVETRGRVLRALVGAAQRDFAEAQLSEVDMSGMDLSNADMRKADLSRANLMGTNLVAANLEGAKLTSAKLQGANLTGANIKGSIEAESAECDAKTFVPEGWSCVANRLAQEQAAP
jgi:hypothetical protein